MHRDRSTLEEEQERSLWRELVQDRSASARLVLIDHYSYLAKINASKCYRNRVSEDVEYGDYLQFAMLGLIEAVQRYDPDTGASFPTYANYRIKGAVLNGLEKSTEQRDQAAYLRRHQKDRIASIAQNDDRVLDDPFSRLVDVTIELALSFMLEESGMLLAENDTGDLLYQAEEIKALSAHLDILVDRLPERERCIVRYHYYHGMPFEELAKCLDISKGRVSQLHKRALQRIREGYEQEEGLDHYF